MSTFDFTDASATLHLDYSYVRFADIRMTKDKYRSTTIDDAKSIAALHVASWRDAYSGILATEYLDGPIEEDRLALWNRRLLSPSPNQCVRVVDADNTIEGFVCAYADADPRWGSLIDNLHVLPHRRGMGIGERLLRLIAGELQTRAVDDGLFLWVFEANTAGIRFYTRLGGKVVESETSEMPAANGKRVLRMHWKKLETLV